MGKKGHKPFRSYAQAERYYIRAHGTERGLRMLSEDHKDVIKEIDSNKRKR